MFFPSVISENVIVLRLEIFCAAFFYIELLKNQYKNCICVVYVIRLESVFLSISDSYILSTIIFIIL